MSKSPEFMQANPMKNEAGLYCKISIAGNEDLEEILKLQKLVYHENAVRYNDYTIAPLTQTMEDLKEEANSSIILKAVEDGKIVGSVRAFEKDGSCRIGRLMVHPDYQNRGLGKKLMRAIEKCFSVLRYELFTGHLDEKNLAFYAKLGYRRFKEVEIKDGLRFVYFEKAGNMETVE
jgi:GNAT superfamily N-acetyltransferase